VFAAAFLFGMTELVEEAKKKYQMQRKNKSVLYIDFLVSQLL
jgi:hypothetical protein